MTTKKKAVKKVTKKKKLEFGVCVPKKTKQPEKGDDHGPHKREAK